MNRAHHRSAEHAASSDHHSHLHKPRVATHHRALRTSPAAHLSSIKSLTVQYHFNWRPNRTRRARPGQNSVIKETAIHTTLYCTTSDYKINIIICVYCGCHCNNPTVSHTLYTFHVKMYVHAIWHGTLWNWKVFCDKTLNNCMCHLCTMVHSMWHTASTYRYTQSVCRCAVPSCPPCNVVPFIPHLPYCEHGHWNYLRCKSIN